MKSRRYDLRRLPEPDTYGNYWITEASGAAGVKVQHQPDDPAIFPIRSVPELRGKWMLSLGVGGIVWDGGQFRAFDSPEAALRELRRRLEGSR